MWRGLPLLLVSCIVDPSPVAEHGDAAGDLHAGDPLQLGAGLTVTTADATVTGELIAVYDHSVWWHDTSDELTLALFNPAALAGYPEDSCLGLVSTRELLTLAPVSSPAPSYRDALRSKDILLHQLPLAGISFVITGHDSYHLEEDGYGDFAWDFVLTDAAGQRFDSAGLDNQDYLVWDAEVFLPAEGYVVEVVRDAPDNLPGAYPDAAVNNIIGLHLYGSFYLYLFHFRQHTIPAAVVPGAVLPAGAYLGRVGNSGVSLEPHLHVTLYWYDGAGTGRSWSVPGEWTFLHWSTSPMGPSQASDYLAPQTGMWLSSQPF